MSEADAAESARVTRLRAAVEQMPPGPSHDRFAELLAQLTGEPVDEPAPSWTPEPQIPPATHPEPTKTVRIESNAPLPAETGRARRWGRKSRSS
jgi:hypothetical protein